MDVFVGAVCVGIEGRGGVGWCFCGRGGFCLVRDGRMVMGARVYFRGLVQDQGCCLTDLGR